MTSTKTKLFLFYGFILAILLFVALRHTTTPYTENLRSDKVVPQTEKELQIPENYELSQTEQLINKEVISLYNKIRHTPFHNPVLYKIPDTYKYEPEPKERYLKVAETESLCIPLSLPFGKDLKIISLVPNGNHIQSNQIVIGFNQDMTILNREQNPEEIGFCISPNIPGYLHWINKRNLVYEITASPSPGVIYSICLSKDIVSLSKQALNENLQFSFESNPPYAESWLYTILKADRKPFGAVMFSQPMDMQSIEEHSYLQYYQKDNRKISIPVLISEFVSGDFEIDPRNSNYYRDFNYELKDIDPQRTYKIMAKYAVPYNKKYQFVLESGIKPKAGGGSTLKNISSQPSNIFAKPAFLGVALHTLERINPYSQLTLEFATKINPQSLKNSLRIYPKAKLMLSADQYYAESSFAFSAENLAPSQNYILYFISPITDCFGNQFLPKPYTLQVGNMPAYIGGLGEWNVVIESESPILLPIQVRNKRTIDYQYKLLKQDQDILKYINYKNISKQRDWGLTTKQVIISADYSNDNNHLYPLDLTGLYGKKKYPCFLRIKDTANSYQDKVVQPTDLGISLKIGDLSGVIWTTHLKNGTNYESVKVRLYSAKGKLLWNGATNKSGLVSIPGYLSLKQSKDNLLICIAESKQDKAYLLSTWNQGISRDDFGLYSQLTQTLNPLFSPDYYTHYDYESYPYGSDPYPYLDRDRQRDLAYIFIERPLFTPGETVRFKSILRREGYKKLDYLAEGEMVEINVYDPLGKDIYKKKLKINKFSSVSGEFQLSESACFGTYTIIIQSKKMNNYSYEQEQGIQRFSVFEFKKKNFVISASNGKDQVVPGELMQFKVKANYLHSGAMTNAKVAYEVSAVAESFTPLGFEQYNFYYTFPNDNEDRYRINYLQKGELLTDEQGTAEVDLKAANFKIPVRYQGNFTVFDEQNDSIGTFTSILVHPTAYYLGIYSPKGLLPAGVASPITVVAISPEGKHYKNAQIQVEVYKRTSDAFRYKGVGNSYLYNENVNYQLIRTEVISYREKPAFYKFNPIQAGEYYLVFKSTDKNGNIAHCSERFSVYGKGDPMWRIYDHDRIDLLADKDMYNIGDTAQILIKSPFNKGLALITIEREGVLDSFTVSIDSAAPIIKVPIKPEYFPNAMVGVNLIQGRVTPKLFGRIDLGKPAFKVGYHQLKVEDKAYRLQINSKTDKKIYEPGKIVHLDMQALDANNLPAKAELAVAVVDEALLALMPYAVDPYSFFFVSRPLSVLSAENRVYLFGKRTFGQKGINSGGGGGVDFDIEERKKFLNAAYWNPSIETDAKGKAVVSFSLPDNLTSYRVIVLGQTQNNKFGHSFSTFQVKKNLMLFPVFPQFVVEGDTFRGGVQIQNDTKKQGEVELKTLAEGLGKKVPESIKIPLQDGQLKTARFDYVALKPGMVTYSFQAKLNQDTDGLSKRLKVREKTSYTTQATYGTLTKSYSVRIPLPENIQEDVSLKVNISSTMLSVIKGAVESLGAYPYECLEQKYSKAIGLLGQSYLNKPVLPGLEKVKIQLLINDTEKYFTTDSGLSFWPRTGESSVYLSYYIGLLFKDLQSKGLYIPESYFSNLEVYFKKVFEEAVRVNNYKALLMAYHYLAVPYKNNYQQELTAFDSGKIELLLKYSHNFSLTERLIFATALSYQDRKQSLAQFDLCKNYMVFNADRVSFEQKTEDYFCYLIRPSNLNNILALRLWLKLNPEDGNIISLANTLRLSQNKNGEWLNTQENAQMILAFMDYAQKKETQDANYQLNLLVNDKNIGRFISKKEGLVNKDYGIGFKKDKTSNSFPVAFEKQGDGLVYYRVELKTKAISDNRAIKEGLEVTRIYKDAQGVPIAENSFELGKYYQVELTLRTNTDKEMLVLADYLPAGFEPVVPELGGGEAFIKQIFKLAKDTQANKYWIDYKDISFEKACAYATNLKPGEYTFTYYVRAAHPGKFYARPAIAEEMYNPEVFGKTIATTVAIAE